MLSHLLQLSQENANTFAECGNVIYCLNKCTLSSYSLYVYVCNQFNFFICHVNFLTKLQLRDEQFQVVNPVRRADCFFFLLNCPQRVRASYSCNPWAIELPSNRIFLILGQIVSLNLSFSHKFSYLRIYSK